MHPQANTEEGNALLPGIPHRLNLALNTAITKTARNENGIQLRQRPDSLSLDLLGIDVFDLHPGIGLQARMIKRFIKRLVSVDQIDVFSDHAYAHRALAFLPH